MDVGSWRKFGAWLGRRGPLPPSVSRAAFLHWSLLFIGWFGSGLLGFQQPSFVGQLAFAGVVATMFGSWLLYWETVLTSDEEEVVADQVFRGGASGNLLLSDWAGITAFLVFFLIVGSALLYGVTLPAYDREHPGLAWLHLRLLRLVLFVVGPTSTVVVSLKLYRLWVHREAQKLRESFVLDGKPEEKADAVRRIVRRFGFGFVFFGSILQMPSALSGASAK